MLSLYNPFDPPDPLVAWLWFSITICLPTTFTGRMSALFCTARATMNWASR
jgi:hypothetical protein